MSIYQKLWLLYKFHRKGFRVEIQIWPKTVKNTPRIDANDNPIPAPNPSHNIVSMADFKRKRGNHA